MLCQLCGAPNPDGRETCRRCGQKLLVLSGVAEPVPDDDEMLLEADEDFEEHLLERLSTAEDASRRLAELLARTTARLAALEHELAITHAGVQAIAGLLDAQGIITRAEIADGWERSADEELRTRDLTLRFRERAPRILSQAAHAGHASPEVRQRLAAVELALAGAPNGLARDQLSDLARLVPGNDELWSFIGEYSLDGGDLESARVAFARVVELRGPHYETLIYLGTVCSDLHRWNEAEKALGAARDLDPASFLPHFTLGALALLRGRPMEAREHLARCLEREELPQALYLQGVAELECGRPARAIAALGRAVELQPDFEDALYHLGVAYLRRGWSRRALEVFQRVLRLDPQRLRYQETVRLLRIGPGDGLAPAVERLVQRAETALARGRAETALELYETALARAPEQRELEAVTTLLASASGRVRDAVRHAHRILRRPRAESPFRAAAVVAVLESLRHAGRLRAARRLARRLFELEGDQLARGLAAYELALVESELGENLERAREIAREALEITPRELRHYPLAALGAIALERGRYREAITYLEQATEGSARPALLRQLAVARLGAGDRDGAEEALAAAADRPSSGLDEEMLGHVRQLGDLLEALDRRTVKP